MQVFLAGTEKSANWGCDLKRTTFFFLIWPLVLMCTLLITSIKIFICISLPTSVLETSCSESPWIVTISGNWSFRVAYVHSFFSLTNHSSTMNAESHLIGGIAQWQLWKKGKTAVANKEGVWGFFVFKNMFHFSSGSLKVWLWKCHILNQLFKCGILHWLDLILNSDDS